MKRLIAVALIMLIVGGGGLWAMDKDKAILGVDAMGAGAILIAVPLVLGWDDWTATTLYVTGGIIGGLGLVLCIYGLVADDPSYAQAVEDNPILKHVSLGTSGEQTYVGVRFSF